MDYITLNQQNFDEITSKGVVLVDFGQRGADLAK